MGRLGLNPNKKLVKQVYYYSKKIRTQIAKEIEAEADSKEAEARLIAATRAEAEASTIAAAIRATGVEDRCQGDNSMEATTFKGRG